MAFSSRQTDAIPCATVEIYRHEGSRSESLERFDRKIRTEYDHIWRPLGG